MPNDTSASDADTDTKAPKGHYYATIGDRRVLVKNLNPGQAMVLGGLLNQINKLGTYADNMAILGKLMRLFNALIVEQSDREWIEGAILDGSLVVENFAQVFVGEEDEQEQSPSAEKKRPRRGR